MKFAKTFSLFLISASLWALFALTLSSCVSGAKIRADAKIVERDIEKAQKSGAYRCAPRDLALAETNVRFTLDELDQGNWVRAEDHVKTAIAAIRRALEDSKECAPKKVVIKQPQVAITKTDRDQDGIPDVDDKCPDVPGLPEFQGCPPPAPLDSDGDGIPDDIDQCPNDPEDFDGFQDEDGCPDPDNDGDGICDDNPTIQSNIEKYTSICKGVDRCPNEPEDFDGFQDEDGCPDPDNDGDGIPDNEDKCPNEAGPPDSPQGKGCPRKYSLVKIDREKKQIEIKQKVHFATGKWVILRQSFGLLNQVAQVLKDYPSMNVSIEGHTDSQGSDSFNLRLSENRANAVREYLIKQGIDESRLESVGHGESRPIASNRTARGRAANRRVEFNIVKE